ncbi:MAG: hypothetical protein RJA70_3079 [Pseudomonadota bacterium]|jgi:hypothetical protein
MAFFSKLFGTDEEWIGPKATAAPARLTAPQAEDQPVAEGDALSPYGEGPPVSLSEVLRVEGPRLRDLVIATALGPVNDEWLQESRVSLAHLRFAIESEGEEALVLAIERLEQWFDSQAVGLPSRTGLRQLLAHFDPLLPGQRTLYDEFALRDRLLVGNLLRQVAGATKALLDRLEATGLWSVQELASLEVNSASKRCDLTSEDDKQRLVQFRLAVLTHLERRGQLQPPETSVGFRTAMRIAYDLLREQEALFQAAQACEERAAIRQARDGRRVAALRVNVLLVEGGLLEELELQERMSIAERLTRLQEHFVF